MQESRSAAQMPDQKDRFFDFLPGRAREKNFVEKERDRHQRADESPENENSDILEAEAES